MIELVKEDAAGSQRGRFAARAAREADEVTAVVTVLARYVSRSDPPIVLEELLTLATPVYGEASSVHDPMSLVRSPGMPLGHSPSEIQEAGEKTLAQGSLRRLISENIDSRRQALEDRQAAIAGGGHEWTKGVDVLEVASTDLLAVSLFFPAHGA